MTQYFYSPSTTGFYVEGIHPSIPDDVFPVSQEEYQTLMEGQTLGKMIAYKKRKLQLVDMVAPSKTWDQIRARRDLLLSKCDWTQMTDNQLSEEDRVIWRNYRQKLRDITATYSDPDLVTWPLAPDATPPEE